MIYKETKKNKRIVFQTSFETSRINCSNDLQENSVIIPYISNSSLFANNKITQIVQYDSNNIKYEQTGNFSLRNSNLGRGDLVINYKSDGGKDGIAGFRCFIKPMHLPYYKTEMDRLNSLRSTEQYNYDKINEHLKLLKNNLQEKELDLKLAKDGLFDGNKGESVLKLIVNLEISFDNFIKLLFVRSSEMYKKYFNSLIPASIQGEHFNRDNLWIREMENLKKVEMVYKIYDTMESEFRA